MVAVVAGVIIIIVILYLRLVVMSLIEGENKSLYEELGAMGAMQLPVPYLKFFWFVLTGRYLRVIQDQFVIKVCHVIRVLELMLLSVAIFHALYFM